jgi:solute carrier family 32 (vesicular inhibitory amino acid transporter)
MPHFPLIKLNATIETLLSIRIPLVTTEDQRLSVTPKTSSILFFSPAVIQRILVTSLSILVSILVPEFSSMMAFLGSFSAFILCVIGPITVKIMLAGQCGIFDGVILALGIMKAIWGTIATFSSF